VAVAGVDKGDAGRNAGFCHRMGQKRGQHADRNCGAVLFHETGQVRILRNIELLQPHLGIGSPLQECFR